MKKNRSQGIQTKKKKFGEREFVKKVWRTMKEQEKREPSIALLHEQLEGKIKLIGVTGGIASGKSLVSSFLQSEKIPILDADAIAHEVVQPKKQAYRQIRQVFGEGILLPDGTLDRQKLGEIVFSDESKKRILESITHPEILREIAKRVTALKKKRVPRIVIDAALLFESGLDRMMHKTVLVRIDPKVQLRRLMARDRLPEAKAWQRILSQMPSAEKERKADFVIDNSGSRDQTRRRVMEVLKPAI